MRQGIRAYAEPVTEPGGAVIAMRGVYQDVSADYHTRLAFAAAREQLADAEERAAEHRLAIRLQEAITPRSAFCSTGVNTQPDLVGRCLPGRARPR